MIAHGCFSFSSDGSDTFSANIVHKNDTWNPGCEARALHICSPSCPGLSCPSCLGVCIDTIFPSDGTAERQQRNINNKLIKHDDCPRLHFVIFVCVNVKPRPSLRQANTQRLLHPMWEIGRRAGTSDFIVRTSDPTLVKLRLAYNKIRGPVGL